MADIIQFPGTESAEQEAGSEFTGWLTTRKFALKYRVEPRTVRNWILKRWVESKTEIDKHGVKHYHVLDIPPTQHPGFRDRPVKIKGSSPRRGVLDETYAQAEKRKEHLREKFLPKLMSLEAGKNCLTAKEVMSVLGVDASTLYGRWAEQGLTRLAMPLLNKSTDKSIRGVEGYQAKYFYTVSQLKKFFGADEGETLDDIVMAGTALSERAAPGFYDYNPKTAFPMSGNGLLSWIEQKQIMVENKRKNRWEKITLYGKQREFLREAFKTKENGDYQYNLILCSAPRGEGKTLLIAIATMFRFFNRFGEVINLSGNSKDQVTFAHYDLIKKMILNTPSLAKTPGLVIKEKSIVLLKGPSDPVCQIKAIPTSTGLLPGTTCAVFTELHKLEDRDFFIDLWTSTRATPNAMVLVDTTVAPKGHIVYSLWDTYCKGEDPLLYFFHYADQIFNPETTPEQLNSFKKHMLEVEYNRYFRNRWEDAIGGVFSANSIRKIGYAGVLRNAA